MIYPKDGKPRLRQHLNGLWELTPPQPLWPDFRESYVSYSAASAYEYWLRDLRAPAEFARQESRDRAWRSLS